jgi:hypothetical protein
MNDMMQEGNITTTMTTTYSYSYSGIAALGEPWPLPELSSTLLSPATYISSSSRPSSLDFSQLTQVTST